MATYNNLGKQRNLIDKIGLTIYDRGGNLKTVIQTSQQVVDFII